VVLDTGALIDAEESAMLQAKHSRSLGGIDSHLAALAAKGAKEFMEQNYVKYGDKSIGDCGTATMFIEGVSMLAAKAVQDSQLYNGQESSTRYIKFDKQPFINPANLAELDALLEELRAFHLRGVEVMREQLAKQHPWDPTIQWGLSPENNNEEVWRKAINARAFDVMRSFLPAGAMTNLAWHSEIRHANDHLLRLRNHPLEEVRLVGEELSHALATKYEHSRFDKRYPDQEAYTRNWMERLYYFDGAMRFLSNRVSALGVCFERSTIDPSLLGDYIGILSERPAKAEPPKFLAECGTMQFSFLLDFASFRDLQRQRALIQRMPMLTMNHGFGGWYLAQMPGGLREEAERLLSNHKKKLLSLKLPGRVMQYYIPMGYRVVCRITGDLPGLIWMVELRSKIDVHPTLRIIAQDIGATMREEVGGWFMLHLDESPDRFNIRRGYQDIGPRNAVA
jgi:thymidylate synthase ThyX